MATSENGTSFPLPAGFGGRVFHLPPIPGDQRVGLSKRRLTFFHGAYFSLPTMYAARFRLSFCSASELFWGCSAPIVSRSVVVDRLPNSPDPDQCGAGCTARAPAALDVDLPLGVALDNASSCPQCGAIGLVPLPPPARGGRRRVRVLGPAKKTPRSQPCIVRPPARTTHCHHHRLPF